MSNSFLGKGKIYLQESGGGLLHIGNCSNFELSIETDSITQPDYTTAGGGNSNEISRVSTVAMSLTMLSFQARNLEIALRGVSSSDVGGAVSDEQHTGFVGALIPFDKMPDTSQTITVTLDPLGTPVTLVEGTDYTITTGGIEAIAGGAITDSSVISVDYTSLGFNAVDALVNSGNEYRLFFDGINEAEAGKGFTVDMYRVKFTPASNLGFIGEDFGELPLEGSVLVDSSKSGVGVSQYFDLKIAD